MDYLKVIVVGDVIVTVSGDSEKFISQRGDRKK